MSRKFLAPICIAVFLSAGVLSAQTTAAVATMPAATAPATAPSLLSGAAWQYSIDDGKTFSGKPPVIPADQTVKVQAKIEFDVKSADGIRALELAHNFPTVQKHAFAINGQEVKGPQAGMRYSTIPAIAPSVLKAGRNILALDAVYKNVSKDPKKPAKDVTVALDVSLTPLADKDLKVFNGPALGGFGEEFFTITCRTNMPATVKVWANPVKRTDHNKDLLMPTEAASEDGLFHRLVVKRDGRAIGFVCILTATTKNGGKSEVKWSCGVPPTSPQGWQDREMVIVAMGDSRTFPEKWGQVAAAALKHKPDVVIFTGDLVADGKDDATWDGEFFQPAAQLLRSAPLLPAFGNHETKAPILTEAFYTPSKDGRNPNFTTQLGPVQIIGVEGYEDWSAKSDNIKWLGEVLSASKAPFVLFANHYPAWSSGSHGKLDKDGKLGEIAMRQAQEEIVPLLAKAGVQAYFCGHDHLYERSDLPGGVTQVTTGGAGAPLYGKAKDAEKQNPHSKVFASKNHFCVIRIKGDTATMTVLSVDGEELDKVTWKARKQQP